MASYIPDAGEDLAYTGSPFSMRNFQNSATAQAGQRGVDVTQQLAAQFMQQAVAKGMKPDSPQAAQYVDQQFAAKAARENIMNGANTKAIMGGPGAVGALAGLTMGGGALLGYGGAAEGAAAAGGADAAASPTLLADAGTSMTDVAPGLDASGAPAYGPGSYGQPYDMGQVTVSAPANAAPIQTMGNTPISTITGVTPGSTFTAGEPSLFPLDLSAPTLPELPLPAPSLNGGLTGLQQAIAQGSAASGATRLLNGSGANDPNSDQNTNVNAGVANPSQGQTTDPNSPGAANDGVTNSAANGAASALGSKTLSDLLGGNVGLGDLGGVNLGDLAKLGGSLAPGILGYLGSSQQTDAYKDLAGKYMAMGAPYRDRLSSLYTPEGIQSYLTSPDVTVPTDQATSAVARALSTKGNPTGSGNALQELQNYSSGLLYGKLGQERDRLAGFGGLSNYSAAAPGASNSGIQSQGNEFSSIGYGLGRALNPQPSFADVAKMFGAKGFA